MLSNNQVVRLLIAVSVVASVACANAKTPNFIFVLADDWGYGDVQAYHSLLKVGIDKPATPRLDRMAAEGTLFTDFHTLGAECSPSRASWFTGRSPSDPKVRIPLVIGNRALNRQKGCADFLNVTVTSVTSALHDAGYTTGHFGKWHLGDVQANGTLPASPALAAYGIDESRCYVCQNPDTYNTSDLWFPSNSSRLIVDDGIKFIDSATKAKKPFYLNLWFHISHAPMNPTSEQLEAYGKFMGVDDPVKLCNGPNPSPHKGGFETCSQLVYRASQFEADAQIGRLLDYLDAQGLSEDTLVIFSGDNGPEDPHIYMNSVGDPGPFRGRKRSLYEGGIRMPFIVRWPSKVPAAKVSTEGVISADWLPTAAALAKVPLSEEGLLGHDISSILVPDLGPVKPRTVPRMWDYRADGYGACWNQAPRLAIRDLVYPELKLLMNVDGSRTEIYNLTESTFEAAQGLATEVPRLKQTLLSWYQTLPPSPVKATHMGCLAYRFPDQDHMDVTAGLDPYAV